MGRAVGQKVVERAMATIAPMVDDTLPFFFIDRLPYAIVDLAAHHRRGYVNEKKLPTLSMK